MQFATEMDAFEYTVDTITSKLEYTWNQIMMEHDENIQAIEYKVLCERGTDDDLEALYIAEAEETSTKGKGVLSGIISLIRKIINKIKKILFGSDDEEGIDKSLKNVDPSMKFELPSDPDKLEAEATGIIGKIRKWISNKKIGERFVDANLDTILAAPTVIAGGAIYNKIKNLGKTSDELDTAVSDCEKMINSSNLTPDEVGYGKKLLSGASKCGGGIARLFRNVKDTLKDKYHTAKEHGKGVKLKSNADPEMVAIKTGIKEINKQIKALDKIIAKNSPGALRYALKHIREITIQLNNDLSWSVDYSRIPSSTVVDEENCKKTAETTKAELLEMRSELEVKYNELNLGRKAYNKFNADTKLSFLNDSINELEKRKKNKIANDFTSDDEHELNMLKSEKRKLESYIKTHKDAAKDARRNKYERNNED